MKREAFNRGWKFYRRGCAGEAREVCLPHDAMMEEKRIPGLAGGETSGYFPGGAYVYERHFYAGREMADQSVLLEFGGVYQRSSVMLNGKRVGGCISGYTRFYADLTDSLIPGAENVLHVEVDNTQIPNSRWYTGSGIYREVYLLTGPKEHYIVPDGVRVSTESAEDSGSAVISVQAEICGPEGGIRQPDIRITAPGGEMLAGTDMEILETCFERLGGRTVYRWRIRIRNARLWSGEHPYLYVLEIMTGRPVTGEVLPCDRMKVRFGIRELVWSAGAGLLCNGEELKLRGACLHHGNGILGACENRATEYRKVKLMKAAGYNAVRTAHNPPDSSLLDACDELGMYVMDEYSDVWQRFKNPYDSSMYFAQEWEKDVTALIRQAYTHPCVVMYSTGNEVAEASNVHGQKIGKEIAQLFRRLDPTRPVTNCINTIAAGSKPSEKPLKMPVHTPDEKVDPRRTGKAAPLAGSKLMNLIATFLPKMIERVSAGQFMENMRGTLEPLDLAGLNYGTHLTASLEEKYPEQLIVHSETYPSVIGKTWPETLRSRNAVGDFMWTGMDYLGECGIGVMQYGRESLRMNKPYPCISAGVGSVNLAGEMEAQGYYTKIVYGQTDVPYIGVHPLQHAGEKRKVSKWRGTDAVPSWTWKGCEGRKAEIQIFSSASEVELFQDGKSLGRKKVIDFAAEYETIYRRGTLSVYAYDSGGRITGENRLKTASERLGICVNAESETLSPDRDMVFIHASLTDEDGIVNVLEERKIRVRVEGPAVLRAVGSGNPLTEESYTSDAFTTYYGSMAAVIQGTGETGKVKVVFSADGLRDETVIITAEGGTDR